MQLTQFSQVEAYPLSVFDFQVLTKMLPNRSQLLGVLALKQELPEDILFREIERFLSNLNSNLDVLSKFYTDHKLDPETKCS